MRRRVPDNMVDAATAVASLEGALIAVDAHRPGAAFDLAVCALHCIGFVGSAYHLASAAAKLAVRRPTEARKIVTEARNRAAWIGPPFAASVNASIVLDEQSTVTVLLPSETALVPFLQAADQRNADPAAAVIL